MLLLNSTLKVLGIDLMCLKQASTHKGSQFETVEVCDMLATLSMFDWSFSVLSTGFLINK